MGIKRVVDVDFWNDSKVIDFFSPEDKYFMLYLLTNPHTTQLGIYELNVKKTAFEMGYSVEAVSVLLDRFEKKYDVIRYSTKTNEVAIKNHLRHSIIKGGKPVEDLLNKEIKKVNDKGLLTYMFSNLSKYNNLNETVNKIVESYPFSNNDNDNDNDNDNEESYHDTYHESLKPKESVNYQEITDLYNTICISYPRLTKLSDARKKAIKARLNIYTTEDFKKLFTMAESSDFLKGKNDRNWSATFDWLIKDSNMAKVLDGNYKNSASQPTKAKPNKFNNFPQREYTAQQKADLERKLINKGL